ncbi:MAG: ATP-binding protein [Pseudomonadota bacterium]
MKATVRAVLQSGLVIELEGRKGFVPKRELFWKDWGIKPADHYEPGREIEVVPYGAPVGDEPRFSVKRANNDPWKQDAAKYQEAIHRGDFPVVRGTVRDVTPTRAYLVLEDFNDAVLPAELAFPQGFRANSHDLTQWFAVGDHVEGRITEIQPAYRRFVLSIETHLEKLALEFLEEDRFGRSWAGTLGSVLSPQLEAKGAVHTSKIISYTEDLTRLRVLGVDDSRADRETLGSILKEIGCSYELPQSKEEFERLLREPGYFDVVFLDKRLFHWEPGLKSTKWVSEIRRHHPGAYVAAFSGESLSVTSDEFKDPEIQIERKPYTAEKVEKVLKSAKGLVKTSSSGAMGKLDEQARAIGHFLSADGSIEYKLSGTLRSLCQGRERELGAAILRMDTVGHEVECLCSHRLSDIPWSDHKSTLRHTPISDVILYNEPFFASRLPETRKRHFPKEIEFTSFAGFPVETFGEIRHGLFVFGSGSDSIPDEIYWRAHNMAFVIARLLERGLMDKVLADEALFSSMGRLYMAMGHEIRDAVTGMADVPGTIRKRVETFEKEGEGSDRELALKDMLKGLDALEKGGRRILEIFDFYADLSRQEKLLDSIDVKALVEDVAGDLKKRHCKDTIFKIKVSQPVTLTNSRIKCKQILRNLMLNAGQQMEEHDWPFSRVYVEAVVDESFRLPVRIIVRDTGPGIHRKDWERAFEPFRSTRKKGAGLGLYLCRLLARSMGGRITVHKSFRFSGTSFLLELPKAVGGRP